MKFLRKDGDFSIIDVGTNNVLLLLARKKGKKIEILNRRTEVSALGKNMKGDLLTESAIRRTKNILNDYISLSKMFTENIIVAGTSCSRTAKNINLLSQWLLEKYNLKYLIISGEDEAFLNGLANIKEFKNYNEFLLFDIGGGSTEFTFIKNKKILESLSVDLGIRRLQNEYGSNLLIKESRTRELLQKLPIKKKITLIGIGGTATSIAAVKHNLTEYNSKLIHKTTIFAKDLSAFYKRIMLLSKDQIAKIFPFEPERSDIILTGTMIVTEILNYFNVDEFIVSDRGFQFGFLNLRTRELMNMIKRTN